MNIDFDEIVSRRGTGSLKWDVAQNELPMWVADMDFKTAPAITEALKERVEHGIFGYSVIPDGWYDCYISWWKERHGLDIERDWLIFCLGAVPAISSTVRKLTTPNEKVLIQTPVYNIFFNSIINNGCRAVESPLLYRDGRYDMDFGDLERKLADPQTSLMIMCNPQNPAGRIWTADELRRVGDLCVKYGVTVISDEIHGDITAPGKDYVPFASVSENCRKCSITCIAPTKAFNIAGTHSAAVVVPDPFLRHKVWRALNTDEIAEPNVFSVTVAEAAFTKGAEWLDGMREYVFENRRIAEEFIDREIPQVHAVRADATYLLWLDISGLNADGKLFTGEYPRGTYPGDDGTKGQTYSEFVADKIRKKTGLYVCEGSEYGQAGDGFLRINLACPKSVLLDGLNRLKDGIGGLKSV